MKLIVKKICLFTLFFIAFNACLDSNSNTQTKSFDRKAFLQEAVTGFIIPAFDDLAEKAQVLSVRIERLTANPSAQTLTEARTAWAAVFISWQKATLFNVGPAAAENLQRTLTEEIGTFPVTLNKIETRITDGNWNLSDFNRDARGILTLDYLLFGGGVADDATLITRLQSANYANYTKAVAQDLLTRVDAVKNGWTQTEIDAFISNDGTDAGSSTSEYYNEYVKSFEALKNFKLALPLGLRAGQTEKVPNLVEGYYSSEYSLMALRAHFDAVCAAWYGTSQSGIGFVEYLRSVSGGAQLIEATEAQFNVVDSVFRTLMATEPGPLSELIEQENEFVIALHTELQRLTRFLKSDLSSLIGIAITYSSGDGD